ncbi:MAG: Cupin 2 conserved barrel domain protein [Thermoleophilia bacterium]|nr:Cupin 2 conserved barrel domain protein [Thermoleophilia bacterium]
MTDTTTQDELVQFGDGWALAPSIDALGHGMFRRVRPLLGITAFGMNVKVMQPDSSSKNHLHTEQQEVIFVHEGEIHVSFGDGSTHEVGVGGIVVIHPHEPHVVRVTSKEPAVLVMMGGKDGVVEDDSQFPEA